jgi:hypothetical protein
MATSQYIIAFPLRDGEELSRTEGPFDTYEQAQSFIDSNYVNPISQGIRIFEIFPPTRAMPLA